MDALVSNLHGGSGRCERRRKQAVATEEHGRVAKEYGRAAREHGRSNEGGMMKQRESTSEERESSKEQGGSRGTKRTLARASKAARPESAIDHVLL